MSDLIGMGMDDNKAPQTQYGLTEAMPRQPSVTEVLMEKLARQKKQLEDTEAALAALKANPEIERVLNLVQKAARW
jgi:hypothetical protein